MNISKEDIVIKALRFAKTKYLNGERFSLDELKEQLKKDGYIQPVDDDGFAVSLFKEITSTGVAINNKKHMSLDSYISLLDYDELKHSLEESKQARKEARNAIWVAIGLGVISMIVQLLTSSNFLNWLTGLKVIGGALLWIASVAFVGYIWDKIKSDL